MDAPPQRDAIMPWESTPRAWGRALAFTEHLLHARGSQDLIFLLPTPDKSSALFCSCGNVPKLSFEIHQMYCGMHPQTWRLSSVQTPG